MTALPTADHVLDCSNTLCPMPIVLLRDELAKLKVGEVIKVIATDPASFQDMPAFARNTGHELLHAGKSGRAFEYYFRKSDEEAE